MFGSAWQRRAVVIFKRTNNRQRRESTGSLDKRGDCRRDALTWSSCEAHWAGRARAEPFKQARATDDMGATCCRHRQQAVGVRDPRPCVVTGRVVDTRRGDRKVL